MSSFEERKFLDDAGLRHYDSASKDWSSNKFLENTMLISGTKEEIDAKRAMGEIPIGAVVNITDDYEEGDIAAADVSYNDGTVKDALDDLYAHGGVTVDQKLNKTSNNPVANAPVATKLEEHDNVISTINGTLGDLNAKDISNEFTQNKAIQWFTATKIGNHITISGRVVETNIGDTFISYPKKYEMRQPKTTNFIGLDSAGVTMQSNGIITFDTDHAYISNATSNTVYYANFSISWDVI